jgi:hypothetical protein
MRQRGGCSMNDTFQQDIKFNCDISDAQFWGYFSVCGLLLRYRDLYRSELGIKLWSDIPRQDIATWIASKEAQWPELEQKNFRRLAIKGNYYDPFDISAVNRALSDRGFVYGAGYGMYFKPSFFLAEIRSVREISGLTVFTSGREMVRDLFTSPAMLQERNIFLRIEPLMVLLLYRYSELNSHRSSELEDAFAQYGFQQQQIIDDVFEQRLEKMAIDYAEILLAHELAEAAEELPEWKDILSLSAGDRKLELYLRAVKDLVADTSEFGPYRRIIGAQDRGALGLTIALTEGYRRVLFPEIRAVYAAVSKSGNWSVVDDVRKAGYDEFRTRRDEIVRQYRDLTDKDNFIKVIKGGISFTETPQKTTQQPAP